jgi:hypothetical protein
MNWRRELLEGLPQWVRTVLFSFPSSARDLNGVEATDPEVYGRKAGTPAHLHAAIRPLCCVYRRWDTPQRQKGGKTVKQSRWAVWGAEIMRSDAHFGLRIVNDKAIARCLPRIAGMDLQHCTFSGRLAQTRSLSSFDRCNVSATNRGVLVVRGSSR